MKQNELQHWLDRARAIVDEHAHYERKYHADARATYVITLPFDVYAQFCVMAMYACIWPAADAEYQAILKACAHNPARYPATMRVPAQFVVAVAAQRLEALQRPVPKPTRNDWIKLLYGARSGKLKAMEEECVRNNGLCVYPRVTFKKGFGLDAQATPSAGKTKAAKKVLDQLSSTETSADTTKPHQGMTYVHDGKGHSAYFQNGASSAATYALAKLSGGISRTGDIIFGDVILGNVHWYATKDGHVVAFFPNADVHALNIFDKLASTARDFSLRPSAHTNLRVWCRATQIHTHKCVRFTLVPDESFVEEPFVEGDMEAVETFEWKALPGAVLTKES